LGYFNQKILEANSKPVSTKFVAFEDVQLGALLYCLIAILRSYYSNAENLDIIKDLLNQSV